MSRKLSFELKLDDDLEEKLHRLAPGWGQYRVLKKSLDARRRHQARWVYSVEVYDKGESPNSTPIILDPISFKGERPVIVGCGPAGMFAALRLVERGIPCQLVEQGSPAEKRIFKITRFWRYGQLDPMDNVCFGEGGAGLFSDGKLMTRIKSPHIAYVMDRLVQFGAPEEVKYLANPHVGSDKIRRLIPKMRAYLIERGCEFHFNTKVHSLMITNNQVTGIRCLGGKEFRSNHFVLAAGHSATELFYHLKKSKVLMEGKSFAVGLRIEHPQMLINKIQYRELAGHPRLGAANYRLADHDKESGIGVYSFCMCPGGYVLSSGTEPDGLVVNGMSNFARNSPFANAAIVVSVDHQTRFGQDLLGGVKFRHHLETKAKLFTKSAGGSKEIPVQRTTDFLEGRSGQALKSSSPSGVVSAPLHKLFPSDIYSSLSKSLERFNRQLPGFAGEAGLLHAVESRTSCPIRILRDKESLESVSHKGLFPCGEGAGYAGGITSAAVDGVKVAEAIVQQLASQKTAT